MNRKDMEYSYEYGNDTVYCYESSNVLKNKLNIRSLDELHKVERELSMSRYFALKENSVSGNFSFEHICAIHKYLFQDIYEWAGKTRSVNITKGTRFCNAIFIETQFNFVYDWLKKEAFLGTVADKTEMSKKLAYVLSEINAIHPFREGNGRTQRMYIEQICKKNGRFYIDFSFITKQEMIEASVEGIMCRYDKMTQLMEKCLIEII